jgi:type IV pilus assembly protein PilN
MIKVNLISVTPGQAPARDWFPKEQRAAAVGLVLLLSTAVGVTGWWWYLRHERTTVEQNIRTAEAELARLKDVAVLVDRATARKMELAERLDLIERLRATMHAPVRLLETVSHSVPHGLWLLEIKQTGTNIQLDGRALSPDPVTEFARQMQESGFFQMPVEISYTSELIEERPVIRFLMKAVTAPMAAGTKVVAANAPPPAVTTANGEAPSAVVSAASPKTEIVAPRSSGGM